METKNTKTIENNIQPHPQTSTSGDRGAFIDKLNWRYATKKYDPEFKLSAEEKSLLEESLQLTPSSFGLQPLHFFWINDSALREKTKTIAWNQQQIVDAAEVL